MAVKRIISQEQRDVIKNQNLKEHKGKDPVNLTREELDDLIVKLAKKAGIL